MNNVPAAAGKTPSVTEYKFALRLSEVENIHPPLRPQSSLISITSAVWMASLIQIMCKFYLRWNKGVLTMLSPKGLHSTTWLTAMSLLWWTATSDVVSSADFFVFGLVCFPLSVTLKKGKNYHVKKINANNKANACKCVLECATVVRVWQLAS